MSLVQLIVPTEVAHDTIAELGELGNVQFKDVSVLLPINGPGGHAVDHNVLRPSAVESRCQSFPTLLRR